MAVSGIKVADGLETAQATKSGSYWTSGNITIYKRGHVAQLKINGATITQLTGRTTIATVPEGFRPITETSGFIDSETTRTFIRPDGQLRVDATSAGTKYGNIIYLVN